MGVGALPPMTPKTLIRKNPKLATMMGMRLKPPALRVQLLTSSVEHVPHEFGMVVGTVQGHYYPAFFARYDRFMRALERAKHSSQLGATHLFRARFARMTRSITSLLAEAWHKPEQRMMTAFLSVTDLFDLPSARHAVDVQVKGLQFRLYSEKEPPGAVRPEELMRFELPPFLVKRVPRVGHPMPPLQRCEVTFDGPLRFDTSIVDGALRRVLAAQYAGSNGNSRMGGREVAAIHTAKEEIEAYRKRIRELEAEEARLKTLFTALRARATSSLLGPSVASLAPLAEQLGAEPLAAAAQAEVILAQQQAMTAQSQAELSEAAPAARGDDAARGAARAGRLRPASRGRPQCDRPHALPLLEPRPAARAAAEEGGQPRRARRQGRRLLRLLCRRREGCRRQGSRRQAGSPAAAHISDADGDGSHLSGCRTQDWCQRRTDATTASTCVL